MTNSPTFKDENLTEHSHIDPDKHWIGEALPAPSLAEMNYAGVRTATGDSIFPARADHSHDTRARFSGAQTSTHTTILTLGNEYLRNFVTTAGENFLHSGSTQLFDFPQEGVYEMLFRYYILPTAGGTFLARKQFDISVEFINATSIHYPVRKMAGGDGTGVFADVFTFPVFWTSVSATSNVQFRYHNYASQAMNVTSNVTIFRKCSSYGA